jgi:2-amino-4-hydroxy-6-hydroxymethyldihydropteridine diphosphokinase
LSNKNNKNFDDAIVVALGSNLPGHYGSSRALLEAASSALPKAGLRVAAASRWWRSAAWPDSTGPGYLNGVVLVETELDPLSVLAALLKIETTFGRERGETNGPRTLDLDLIAYGRRTLAGERLTLPHPRAHLRGFVMGPLAEIAPRWRHPVLGRTASELARGASVGAEACPVQIS